jgi:ATP-dependent RNA helicase DDX24/MAK5
MLEKGHFQELHNLLELLNLDEGKKRQRQNFVFSATLTMVHEPPGWLKSRNKKLRITPGQKLQNIMTLLGVTNPKVVDVTKESGERRMFRDSRPLPVYCAYGVPLRCLEFKKTVIHLQN